MVEPPKSSTFNSPLHSSQHTTSSRDLVTHITGANRSIPIGALLEGKVISQNPSGLTTLQTAHGDITFQTQIGLLKGSLVTLRVTSTGEDFQARLVTINGQSLLDYLGGRVGDSSGSGKVTTTFTLPQDEVIGQNPQSNAALTAQQGKGTASIPSDTVLQRNSTVPLTLLSADRSGISQFIQQLTPQAREQFITQLQQLAPGNNVNLSAQNSADVLARAGNVAEFKVLNYQLPTANVQAQPAGNQPSANPNAASANITSGTSAASPNSSSNLLTPNQTGQALQGQSLNASASSQAGTSGASAGNIANPSLPNAAQATFDLSKPLQIIPDAKTGNVRLQAVVIGQETNGQSVIKTALGIFHYQKELPRGATLELEFVTLNYVAPSSVGATSNAAANFGATDALGKLLNFWKLFPQTDTAKMFKDAGTTRFDSFQSRFPNPSTDFGANLLRYFSAVGKQDPRELLGKNLTEFLQRTPGGQDTLEQLTRDLGANRQLLQQSQYDWRSLVFPVVSDGTWYANRLMLKEYEGKDEAGESERGVRFVIELDMEKLGPLQLDGLVRKGTKQQFFDLTIRSEQPIPKAARDAIFDIFQEAQDEFGVEGRLVFQLTEALPDLVKESATIAKQRGDGDDSIIV